MVASFVCFLFFFFFKQKTAYEISECDWSADVCSSDLNQSNAELTAITVRKGEAKKLTRTKDNEFLLNGKMYDVVRIEKTKSDITYFCLQDEKEEALFEHLDGLVLNELE